MNKEDMMRSRTVPPNFFQSEIVEPATGTDPTLAKLYLLGMNTQNDSEIEEGETLVKIFLDKVNKNKNKKNYIKETLGEAIGHLTNNMRFEFVLCSSQYANCRHLHS